MRSVLIGLALLLGMASAACAEDAKWRVTVIHTAHCVPCERLKSDFQRAPDLVRIVGATGWAEYRAISGEEAAREYADLRIGAYPTLLLQPPKNGALGDAKAIVRQWTGYDGNARRLARAITVAARDHARKHLRPKR